MTPRKSKPAAQILIVDDDQLVRDFVVHTLEYGMNQQILAFESGFDAWQFIHKEPGKADIIIADANIADIDGFELLTHVKTMFPEKFFIITAVDGQLEEAARKSNADAFMTKPSDAKDLFALIRNVTKYYLI